MIEFRNQMLITKLNIAIHQDARCGGMLKSIEKFQVSEFCWNSVSLVCIQPLRKTFLWNFHGGKMRHARKTINTAVTIVTNVKVGVNAIHSTHYQNIQNLFGKALLLSQTRQWHYLETEIRCVVRQGDNNWRRNSNKPGIRCHKISLHTCDNLS